MATDPFASSTFTLVASWIAAIPIICGLLLYLVSIFEKQEGVPRAFTIWLGLCFLVFGPVRYIFFLVTAASSYPFQSWYAFLTLISIRTVLFPIAFGILFFVGLSGPLILAALIAGNKTQTRLRYFLSALATPFLAMIGSALFAFLLPLLTIFTTHGLRTEDVIGATNGPAYYAFTLCSPCQFAFPPYTAETARTNQDLMRLHVAWIYLSHDDNKQFVEASYPDSRSTQVATVN